MRQVTEVLEMVAAGNTDPDELAQAAKQALVRLADRAVPFASPIAFRQTDINRFVLGREQPNGRLIWMGEVHWNGQLLVHRQVQAMKMIQDSLNVYDLVKQHASRTC